MKKIALVSIGCLFLVAGVAAAQGRGHCGHGMHGAALLQKADANHDGRVTRDELVASERARFQDSDKNQDGRVTAEEMRATFEQKKAEHFASKDKNSDGTLSADEVSRMPQGVFTKLDKNGDGALSRDELGSFGPHRRGPGAAADGAAKKGHGGFFKALDTNGDGAITQDEADAAADEHFERMDKNGDNAIDASELRHGGRHGRGAQRK